jgi:hypothetical protein
MSVNDDGDDLGPETETRGGRNPDWENAKPGEPLPEKPLNLDPPEEDEYAS